MSTPETPEPAAPETPAPDATPEPQPTADSGEPTSDDLSSLRREAAGYRRRLRETETERDRLASQVDARDRADAERLAGEQMASGSDLWAAGVELAQLRGEDGALAVERVREAVVAVLAERPHWRRPSSGFDGGARATMPAAGPSFGEALKHGGRLP